MFPVIDRTRRRKQLVHPCGDLPIVSPSYRARAEHHPLLVIENADGDRAELHNPPALVFGDDVADPTHELPVVVIGNGEYRRAIHANGVGVLWKDMAVIAVFVVIACVFVWMTGGAV